MRFIKCCTLLLNHKNMAQISVDDLKRVFQFLSFGQTKGAWSLDLAEQQVLPFVEKLEKMLDETKETSVNMTLEDVRKTVELLRHSQKQGAWNFAELKQLILPLYNTLQDKLK